MTNTNNEEINASESTISYSLEPYCEMIHIIFVYGQSRIEKKIEVPIEALNNEIYHSGFKVIPFLPSDKENSEIRIRVELPPVQIPWDPAIRQFEKYLKPPHKNNKRITNSPIIPVSLTSQIWLPLYYLTKRFDMQILQRKLLNINFTTNYCISILSQIYEMTSLGYKFPEVDSIIFKTLSSNLDSLPPHSFSGIEMASAILKIVETDQNNSINPPSLIEWLVNIFPKFAEDPNQSTNRQNIFKIITYLKIDGPKTAFILWCYSLFFDPIDSDQILDEYIHDLELKDNYKLLFNVPLPSVFWLFDRINLDLNKVQVAELIIQLIRASSSERYNSQKRSYESQKLFNFAIENHLLNIDRLDTQALCILLPYAYNYNPNGDLVHQFILRIKSGSYESAVSCKNRNYALLPWDLLLSAFSLLHHPKLNNRKSNPHNDMRLAYKNADSIFFHWIYTNRNVICNNGQRLVGMGIIDSYISLPSTDVSLVRSPHRRLLLYDVLTCLPPSPNTQKAKQSLFDPQFLRQPFNFVECLNRLLSKKSLHLTIETLFFLKHCIKKSVYKMTLFCSVLEKFYIPIPDPRLIDPVNEYSIKSCIQILHRSIINNPKANGDYINSLIQIVKPMATYAFNMLSIQEITNLARIIPFREFIIDNFIASVDEDNVLFYAFSTQNFCSIIMSKNSNMQNNWKYQKFPNIQNELSLINWSHVSTRALVKLISPYLDFLQNVNFQFDEEEGIIPNLPLINSKKIAETIYNEWMFMNPYRTPNSNLSVIPPKTVCIYLIDFGYRQMDEEENILLKEQFKYIGFNEIKVTYVNEKTIFLSENDDAVIIYKNIEKENNETPPTSIKNFIHSLFQAEGVPIVINSVALLQILEECREEWFHYVGENNVNYDFVSIVNGELESNQQFNNNYGFNYHYSFEPNYNSNNNNNFNQGYNNYNQSYNNNQNYYNNNYGGYNNNNRPNNLNGNNGGGYYQSQFRSRQSYTNASEHIIWKDPTQSLLPLKKDLIQFTFCTNSKNIDYYFKSIPFFSKFDDRFLKSKIEWKSGRIFACSLIGRPLSIFNFGLSINLNKITKEDNHLSVFYYYTVLKQTSDCLLSLLCESAAGINPVFFDVNPPFEQPPLLDQAPPI